jgi:sterol desaturase/sphingolipid hydroxylase (fatty acid hydroxylase superfamily)
VAAVGAALVAEARGWGLFALMGAPPVLAALGAILILDLVVYAQHWALHRVPALWRIHRVHHADTALDVTTALRFHPIEIALSMLVKMAAVVALGAPPEAVVAFEVLLNATAMFNHANVRLPPLAERMLRWIVVTPGMHRVHHSTAPDETNSNYGFNLPWWDRLFRTYRSAPQAGDGIVIGLERFREPRERRLDRVLMQPLL